MEMTPEQLEQLSTHLFKSIAGNVDPRRLLGKVVEEKRGHATAVIQMCPDLADATDRVAVRAESIQNWDSLDDWIAGNVRDEYKGHLWAVFVQLARAGTRRRFWLGRTG